MNKTKTAAKPAETPRNVLPELRRLMPTRTLRLYEHLGIAERQATRLHRLLGQTAPATDLTWLTELPGVTVVLVPRWKMDGLSGMTTWDSQRWVIGVNGGNPHARRRFTLCHEFKHVLDANRDKLTYRSLDDRQRELVADYFAACYLMPKVWLRRVWTGGLQDPEALAGLFNVSLPAMQKRLRYLGFIDPEPERNLASYFRTARSPLDAAA